MRLHVGNSQTLFHTSCGYAFLQNAISLRYHLPENKKDRSQAPPKVMSDSGCSFTFYSVTRGLQKRFLRFFKKLFARFLISAAFGWRGFQHILTQESHKNACNLFLHRGFQHILTQESHKNACNLFLHKTKITCYNLRNLEGIGHICSVNLFRFLPFLFLLGFRSIQNREVSLCNQIFLRFIPGFPVFSISLFL